MSRIARSRVAAFSLLVFAALFAGAPRVAAQAPARSVAASDSAAALRFASRAESILLATPVSKGEWGLLVVDAATGQPLYALNPDSFFVPASNMKLLTTALALDTLGVDYRFRTTVESPGALSSSGTLSGDLVLVGRGDPNLSNRKFPFESKEEFDGPPSKVFDDLAAKIAARGVRKISGDIVADDSYFPRERYPDGWEIDDMVWEYGAAVSALVVNDNTVKVTLTPGASPGSPVHSSIEPPQNEFTLSNLVSTSPAKEKSDLTLTRDPGAPLVTITGTLAAHSSPRELVLAIQEPASFAAFLFSQSLAARGISWTGKLRVQHDPDPAEASRNVLAEHLSLPLGTSVKLVNKISQNLHTEVLLRASARSQGRWSSPDDLPEFPVAFYQRAGIPAGDVIQTDGSGLSRHDMVTPRAFVALLEFAQQQPWFTPFFDSLPVAGVDGTLGERFKNSPIVGRIHAKTGSVTHVRSLSGYADTPSGRRLIFSLLSNNQGGRKRETSDAIEALCLAMIEEFDAPPSGAGK